MIAGKWGVGKTFAWNRFLADAKRAGKVRSPYYAYVSLFGLGSLDELKAAVFQNTVQAAEIGKAADLDTLNGVVKSAPALWRKGGTLARLLPGADKYLSNFEKVGFFWIKEQIICIDDLERKSRNLDLRDVLGLISYLKEQRRCKVVLLLNEEQLAEVEAAEFHSQLEKIGDVTLRFDPTPAEAAEIGINPRSKFCGNLRANCEKLGIVNIRTLKKIERMAARLDEELIAFDPRVLKQAIQSVALFAYAKFHPDDAPSVEFLRSLSDYEAQFAEAQGGQPSHPEWRAILDEYGFAQVDEFDSVILQSVLNGHLDAAHLQGEAKRLEQRLIESDGDRSFSEAWELYHDSFEDNGEIVRERFIDAIRKTPKAISPTHLSATVALIKELGGVENIDDLLAGYVEARGDEDVDFWDLEESTFGEEVRDPDVREAFRQKFETFQERRSVSAILIEIGKKKGWDPADVEFVSHQSSDALYLLFKTLRGNDLRRAVAGALMFKNVGNPSEEMNRITANASSALARIAAESVINRRRVLQKGGDVAIANQEVPLTGA
ncbi:MAG TPA: hypothetical protein VF655_12290 [Allosphingosinicella sp.]